VEHATPPPSVNKPTPENKPETLLGLLDMTDDDMSFLNSPSWLSDRESYQLPPIKLPPIPPVNLQAAPFTAQLPPPLQPAAQSLPQHAPQLIPQPAPQSLPQPAPEPTPQSSWQYEDPSGVCSRRNVNCTPQPHFSIPSKLKLVEQVMRDYPVEDLEALCRLAGALACNVIF